MDWGAVSAVAEILGAIGVVVTLLYLTRQVRENTASIRRATARDALQSIADFNQFVASDPVLVDLFWRRKSFFVYFGAALMTASLLIMVGLTGHMEWMAGAVRSGSYLHCPNGSHLTLYDDQETYFEGLIRFIREEYAPAASLRIEGVNYAVQILVRRNSPT